MMHKKACKQFKEQTKDMDYWNHVLWSDETKTNLFGSDGVKRVWRQPAMIGLLYPCIDSRLGEPHKFKREWSSVMRCVAVFVGINHASAKVDFANNIQLSLTLAALSIGLWWTFDRSRSGFGLGVSIALLATMATQLLVYNGVFQYTSPDFLYIRSWLPCIFFAGVITMGNIGRQLALVRNWNQFSKSAFPNLCWISIRITLGKIAGAIELETNSIRQIKDRQIPFNTLTIYKCLSNIYKPGRTSSRNPTCELYYTFKDFLDLCNVARQQSLIVKLAAAWFDQCAKTQANSYMDPVPFTSV
ncbi:hypothetical protein L3Q82_017809 [Scortum barcoo]|uniref:Uncharacterized protein n=1 Tax=Scortum barcoo TaxID=214431 RepID=A0ACB8VLZ4_9TELE|nr:hypothetical protein L3Q82_017809 [Scortum barcoo]